MKAIGTFGAIAATLALAACGGSSSSGYSGSSSASSSGSGTATPVAEHADVNVRSTDLGKVLVDRQGRTVYMFAKDTGTTSTCGGACAANWPPVVAKGKPTAGPGVDKAKLGTTKRADGTRQVTYAGHPVYTFVADRKAGDTKGQDISAFGAKWYAMATSGAQAKSQASGGDSSGGGSSSHGGGGYGY